MGLRGRLLILVLLAVLPALAIILYSTASERQIHASLIQKDALVLADTTATRLGQNVEGIRQVLLAIGTLPELRGDDAQACNRLLAGLLAQYPQYDNFGVVSADGIHFASALPFPPGLSAADRVWFTQVITTGDFSAGEFQIGRLTKKPTLNFGFPLKDAQGRLQRVLYGALDLEWLNRQLVQDALPAGAVLTVFDRKGAVLARSFEPERWIGQSFPDAPLVQRVQSTPHGTTELSGLDGVSRLYAFSVAGGPAKAFHVAVGIPRLIATAHVRARLWIDLAVLLGVTLLAVAAAWFGGLVFVVRPIRTLIQATDQLSGGNLGARVTESGHGDELARVNQAFNVMAESLQKQITERRRAEEALRMFSVELEERVRERTSQLETANKELEAFSYSVSHDLRAPLRAVDGFSHALVQDCGDRLTEEGRDHLKRIRAAASRMGQLIDDLLTLSRLSRSALRKQTVDLSALARTILGEFQNLEPQRKVEVRIAENLRAEADPNLIRVALENLLGNAWKFTSKRPEASIEFGQLEAAVKPTTEGRPTTGPVTFFIRDNGAGFNMAYADKLFGAFQRMHRMDEFPGTGIGLATVARIIRRHGGDIRADGAVDHGATFFFSLEPMVASVTDIGKIVEKEAPT